MSAGVSISQSTSLVALERGRPFEVAAEVMIGTSERDSSLPGESTWVNLRLRFMLRATPSISDARPTLLAGLTRLGTKGSRV
jgi:hypothetical protein